MSSTADVLFSKTQQRLLAALFSETAPEGLSYAELLRRTAGGAGAIHRELQQFVAAGLVVEKRIAGRRLFRANPGHAVYGELSSLAKKLLETPRKLDASTARSLAQKYMWWTTPAEASKNQARLVAQVMNIGDYDDVQRVAGELGDEYLRNVLRNAEAGQFDERSWSYWHYRLGLARPGELPTMPARAAG